MANIWHNSETPGFDKGKREVGFTRWRVLVMQRTAELTELGEDDAVKRIHDYGLAQLGIAYDGNTTAEDLAQTLSHYG